MLRFSRSAITRKACFVCGRTLIFNVSVLLSDISHALVHVAQIALQLLDATYRRLGCQFEVPLLVGVARSTEPPLINCHPTLKPATNDRRFIACISTECTSSPRTHFGSDSCVNQQN
jgi:hypothetical protein